MNFSLEESGRKEWPLGFSPKQIEISI